MRSDIKLPERITYIHISNELLSESKERKLLFYRCVAINKQHSLFEQLL